MARIEFADGTFTTREPHEANPNQAIPEGAVLVDHGPVVTTGLPDDHPKEPLGAEILQAEGVEVVEPANAEKVEHEPKAEQRVEPRRTVRTQRPKKEPDQRVGATGTEALHAPSHQEPKDEDKVSVGTETDRSGSVPQERVTFGHGGTHAPTGGDSGRSERTSHDDD